MAVWGEYNGTPYNTYARRYNAATGLWDGQTGPGGAITASTATNISNDPSQDVGYFFPSLAADCSGNFMAVWSEYNGKPYNTYARRYNAATGLWDGQTGPGGAITASTATNISNDPSQNGGYFFPSLAADCSGNFMAVWGETNGTPNTYARRYNAATGLWDGQTGPGGAITASTATNISNDVTQSFDSFGTLSLSANCCGDIFASWGETNGSLEDALPPNVYVRRYNAPQPVPSKPPADIIEANRILCIDEHVLGCPVYAVSWLCRGAGACCGGCVNCLGNRTAPLAAVAHGPIDGNDLSVWRLADDHLERVASVASGMRIRAIDGCVIDGTAYLAVVGTPDDPNDSDVKIFMFGPRCCSNFQVCQTCSLTCVSSFKHGASVRAGAWLCRECPAGDTRRALAIGGSASKDDRASVRVLTFDATTNSVENTANFVCGGTINAVAWLLKTPRFRPILVAGGTRARHGDNPANIHLLAFDCPNKQCVPMAAIAGPRPCVTSLCVCDDGCAKVIAGFSCESGHDDDAPITVEYVYKPQSRDPLKPYACAAIKNPCRSVKALALAPSAHGNDACAYVTLGLEGSKNDVQASCSPNIAVCTVQKDDDERSVMCRYDVTPIATTCLDESITSLSWCMPCGAKSAYLLAGAAGTTDDLGLNACPPTLAVYKARWCAQNRD